MVCVGFKSMFQFILNFIKYLIKKNKNYIFKTATTNHESKRLDLTYD